jgi:hypothetical protein
MDCIARRRSGLHRRPIVPNTHRLLVALFLGKKAKHQPGNARVRISVFALYEVIFRDAL